MRNRIIFDNYHNSVAVSHRKEDITAEELTKMQEAKEYRQAVLIGVALLLIPIAVGIASHFIGVGNSW